MGVDATVHGRHDYLRYLSQVIESVSRSDVEVILEALKTVRTRGRTVFLLGNGGSAATASHAANDFCKGAIPLSGTRLRALALTDCIPLMTAWANDSSYKHVFSEPLDNFVQPDDLVIAISASGNSPNVLCAVELANERGAKTIGLTGMGGGKLKDLARFCLIIDSDSYQAIEDAHMAIIHAVCLGLRDD